jgi:hypothetical protein
MSVENVIENLQKITREKNIESWAQMEKTSERKSIEKKWSILYAWPWGLHLNVILSRDSQVKSLEILEIGTLATSEAHNFLCIPPIEVRSKINL